ncbi:MAG: HAD-IB family phosphatase [Rickettsiales bacterium]|jgi:D-3-phosphoglycerate dehydrogenase|nr:HAD-IB family phosphatase [Rickettsiales bacterium]
MKVDIFVIDFDSTFIELESIEMLFKLALRRNSRRVKLSRLLSELDKQLIQKKIDFQTNFEKKIEILKLITKKQYLEQMGLFLNSKASEDIKKIVDFARKHKRKIMVFSNSFNEILEPVMKANHIDVYFSNKLIYNQDGYIIDYDKNNIMAKNSGKASVIQFLKRNGFILPDEKIMLIGDGVNDYKVYKNKICDYFVNFAIHCDRGLDKFKEPNDKNFIICRETEDVDNLVKMLE